jgi:hypothetical protein
VDNLVVLGEARRRRAPVLRPLDEILLQPCDFGEFAWAPEPAPAL